MFRIGADVFTRGEKKTGELIKVAVDPHSREVTDLVIDRGLLGGEARVIPVTEVEQSSEERIDLSIDETDLEHFPAYREHSFELADDAVLDDMGYESDEAFTWAWRYGVPVAPVKPRIREHRHEGLESGRAAIGRGTRVRNASETIGYVDHVLVDRRSGEVSHLIVRRGLLPFRVSIPFEMVEEVSDESVYVPAARAELESLARYMPRADLAIKAEAQTRLAELGNVQVDDVEIDVADGVVMLDGYVPNIEARRDVHQAVRRIEGAVGVEDRLLTDRDLRAGALTALLLDPRTELERIEVRVEAGVATLEGVVKDERLKLAAEGVVGSSRAFGR